MCRNIKTLANFDPPATHDEIRASALQFVRKLSGMKRPSKANEAAFDRAVDEVTIAAERLIASLATNAPPRNRDVEAEKARQRSRRRFASVILVVCAFSDHYNCPIPPKGNTLAVAICAGERDPHYH